MFSRNSIRVAPALRFAGAIFFLSLFLSPALSANDDVSFPELPNFHKVNDALYRGAQPKAGGIARLKALGIRTIINLREGKEEITGEREEAEKAGIKYFSVPLPDLSRPSDEQIDKILKLINQPENARVFVHCNHGRDRTGTVIACYRISHDGWTSKKAKDEAKSYGMSRFQFGMADYISDFAKRHGGK